MYSTGKIQWHGYIGVAATIFQGNYSTIQWMYVFLNIIKHSPKLIDLKNNMCLRMYVTVTQLYYLLESSI